VPRRYIGYEEIRNVDEKLANDLFGNIKKPANEVHDGKWY
jgi:hypothetical protein